MCDIQLLLRVCGINIEEKLYLIHLRDKHKKVRPSRRDLRSSSIPKSASLVQGSEGKI